MKKILFVITKSNWGGAQRYVYNLATALPKENFEVAVALGGTGVAGSEAGELQTRLSKASVATFYISAFARDVSILSDIEALFELYRLFKKEKPDIVHLNSSKAGGIGALAARLASFDNGHPIEIIFTSHGLVWDEDRNTIARFIIKAFSLVTFLLSHKVITISHDNFERARSLPFCRNKIYLVHNGIPQLQFDTPERARLALALHAKIPEELPGPWVGTISELTRNKGLFYLLHAAKKVVERNISFHLFIIGGGEEERFLTLLIAELALEKHVHLVGFVSDAYRFDRAFDVFTLSSIKEGLPTVLLEAGQAGVAVIATHISGVPDIIDHEKTGLLVEPKNAQDLADKLCDLLQNPQKRNTFSEALQKKVIQQFSLEQMIEETLKLY